MRKLFISISLISTLLTGCIDGDDGYAYLAFYWIGTPQSYADNNPGVPATIFWLEEYLVNPGTYSFSYVAFEGSAYAGTYTITEEEGEPGIFPFIPGEDGEDNHFELWLFSSGPSFWETSIETELAAAQSYGADPGRTTSLDKNDFIKENLNNANEETVLSQTKGRYTMTLRYRKQ
jgi:hypothetical protein